ncbi:MAG: prolipoprotein diacylglyceryl transferase [Thermostichales cyanobacterium SZTDM-1c_bins_54]
MAIILQSPGPILWQWGPLSLRWYGVFLSLGVAAGTGLSYWLARRRGLDAKWVLDVLGWLVLGAIPAARLYYVLFAWEQFAGQPWWSPLAIWQGGLAIHGALIGGLVALGVCCWRSRQPLGPWLDVLAPGVILGQAIGRWGNFFNNEAYGQPLQAGQGLLVQLRLPDGSLVHPTFLYESLWNLGVLCLLLGLSRHPRLPTGTVFWSYWIGYSCGRFWIEGLRTDSLMWAGFRVAQGVSLTLIVVATLALWWIFTLHRDPQTPPVTIAPAPPEKPLKSHSKSSVRPKPN